MEKLLGLEVGRRYSFMGVKPEEGHIEIDEVSEHGVYWGYVRRKGWYDGKLFPFDADGKFIGAKARWSVPDLEFDLGPINPVEVEIPIEQELPVEQELELQLGEEELKL